MSKTAREIELEEKVAAGLRRELIHLNRAFRAEKKLEIAIKALKWIEEQADTSTQYDYDAEVILKNIVFDAQQALKEFRDDD